MNPKKFASVAEAAAHYYEQGYETVHAKGPESLRRALKKGPHRVYIYKVGLLDVEAYELTIGEMTA